MIVLGIETSCDETAASVITDDGRILSSVVLSQIEEHRIFGGVVPEIAARSHLEYVDKVITQAIKEAQITVKDLDVIAATGGPGLIGGVIVGVTSAKAIALALSKPFIAVNHLEGHALTPRLFAKINFPYLLLLASGGHCQILVVKGVGNYECLGATIDDSAGEAFDKLAKMLNIGYPGGVAVEKAAKTGDDKRFSLPIPMKGKPNCNFSFSGLKTAAHHLIEKLAQEKTLTEQDKSDIAACFQKTICDSIINRLSKAVKIFKNNFPDGEHLVVAGGVAANLLLRSRLEKLALENKIKFNAPPLPFCTDNAAMIAWAGIERYKTGSTDSFDFKPRPRWSLTDNIGEKK